MNGQRDSSRRYVWWFSLIRCFSVHVVLPIDLIARALRQVLHRLFQLLWTMGFITCSTESLDFCQYTALAHGHKCSIFYLCCLSQNGLFIPMYINLLITFCHWKAVPHCPLWRIAKIVRWFAYCKMCPGAVGHPGIWHTMYWDILVRYYGYWSAAVVKTAPEYQNICWPQAQLLVHTAGTIDN